MNTEFSIIQINLVVGNYFKAKGDLLEFTDKALELIAWLRSKTLTLALIRKAQEDTGQTITSVL